MSGDPPHIPGADAVDGPGGPEDDGHLREPARTVDEISARLLGAPRTMRRQEISAEAGVPVHSTRRFWRALGFPNVREEDTVFTDADLVALQSMVSMVRRGLFTEEEALALTRALGRSTDRLAVWQTQLISEVLQGPGDEDAAPDSVPARPDPEQARRAAHQITEMADALEPLVIYAWRRHLGGAISRMIADAEPVEEYHGVVRTVGFADLVSFTELVRRSTEQGLSRLVQRFEALSSDVVASLGGQVIKTVGDEVLFQSQDPRTAGEVAVELVRAIEADDLLPEVRVGMAIGRVLPRLGDVYGTTVNRAARLTAEARAGTVLVDEDLATALGGTAALSLTMLEPRVLQGLGEVTPFELDPHRCPDDGAHHEQPAGNGPENDPDDQGEPA